MLYISYGREIALLFGFISVWDILNELLDH